MIYFIPWGDNNTASSRLRVYNVLPHMDASLDLPEEYQKGDVLIIQKAIRMDELEKAQSQGAKVIYDIDDNFLDQQRFVEMTKKADMVTVGSKFFHRYFPDAPVIDDTLDWDGTKKEDYTTKNLFSWHGYGNLNYVSQIAPIFEKRGIKTRVIVGEEYKPFYTQYDAHTWDLQTIDTLLAESDFCAFYLPDDDFSQAKGMNKLIKAWAIGLPCLVSPTEEYLRVSKETGIDDFITTDWESTPIPQWKPEMREYALRFSPETVANQWKSVISLL